VIQEYYRAMESHVDAWRTLCDDLNKILNGDRFRHMQTIKLDDLCSVFLEATGRVLEETFRAMNRSDSMISLLESSLPDFKLSKEEEDGEGIVLRRFPTSIAVRGRRDMSNCPFPSRQYVYTPLVRVLDIIMAVLIERESIHLSELAQLIAARAVLEPNVARNFSAHIQMHLNGQVEIDGGLVVRLLHPPSALQIRPLEDDDESPNLSNAEYSHPPSRMTGSVSSLDDTFAPCGHTDLGILSPESPIIVTHMDTSIDRTEDNEEGVEEPLRVVDGDERSVWTEQDDQNENVEPNRMATMTDSSSTSDEAVHAETGQKKINAEEFFRSLSELENVSELLNFLQELAKGRDEGFTLARLHNEAEKHFQRDLYEHIGLWGPSDLIELGLLNLMENGGESPLLRVSDTVLSIRPGPVRGSFACRLFEHIRRHGHRSIDEDSTDEDYDQLMQAVVHYPHVFHLQLEGVLEVCSTARVVFTENLIPVL